MFTVLFALGRLPGWIAHWREMHDEGGGKIGRPRQIYTGYTERDYVDHQRSVVRILRAISLAIALAIRTVVVSQ